MITLETSEPIDPVDALEALLSHGVNDVTTQRDWSWKKQLTAAIQGIRTHLARTAALEQQVEALTAQLAALTGKNPIS